MSDHYCEKCHKTMSDTNFYTYKDGRKTEMCKKCLTMHIDNFNPDTFVWLLEKMDVPYIPEEWNVLRDKAFAKNPQKMNGMSVFGKYLSKMKLNQWKEYSWADTERLAAQRAERDKRAAAEREQAEARIKQDYEDGKITEAEYKTLMSVESQHENESIFGAPPPDYAINGLNAFNENNFMSQDDLPDPASELTEDDKLYLAMKWGRLYQPHEWVELETHYEKMMNSFDIQDADTEST